MLKNPSQKFLDRDPGDLKNQPHVPYPQTHVWYNSDVDDQ